VVLDDAASSPASRADRHVAGFNDAVRTGRWAEFGAGFTDDATMRFTNVSVGPFDGRDAIVRAYVEQPPDDTMTADSVDEIDDDTALVHFRWDNGGPGTMHLRWRDGLVAELVITFGRSD
jgi:steroid delta-isomerase